MRAPNANLLVALMAILFAFNGSATADETQSFYQQKCRSLLHSAGEALRVQGGTLGPATLEDEEDPEIFAQQRLRSPLGASDVATPLRTEASFSAGSENGRAYLSLTNKTDTMSDRVFAIKISVPFDKDKGEGVFASRAGVSGDIVFSASTSKYLWNLNTSAYADKLCQICEKNRISPEDCYPESSVLANLQIPTGSREDLADNLFGTVAAIGWGLEGEAARKKREYFDTAAAKNDEDRIAASVSGVMALHLRSASIFAKLTAKRDYKEMDKAQRCSPIEDTMGLESCKQLPLGRAKEVEGLVASLQDVQELGDFAVAPTVQYDFDETDWTVLLPIYVIWQPADKKADDSPRQWIGGLKLAWASGENDEFGAAIFISTPLKW